MATVANLDGGRVSGADRFVDSPLTKFNRENAGNPNGALTPQFVGEIIFDTTNDLRWRAADATNSNWYQLDPGPGTIA